MSKKSIPTKEKYVVANRERVEAATKLLNEMNTSEITAIIIEASFLIRKKTTEELLAMLNTTRKEIDENPTDNN